MVSRYYSNTCQITLKVRFSETLRFELRGIPELQPAEKGPGFKVIVSVDRQWSGPSQTEKGCREGSMRRPGRLPGVSTREPQPTTRAQDSRLRSGWLGNGLVQLIQQKVSETRSRLLGKPNSQSPC